MTGTKKIVFILFVVVSMMHLNIRTSAQWLENKTLQTGRSRLVALTAGTKVYFAGGFDGSNVQNKIDVYDNTTGELKPFTSNLSVARADLTGTYNASTNKLFFAGGQTNSSKSSVIEVYNLNTNNWEAQLALPRITAYMCAASVGSKVLFAGGSNNSGYYDELYVYDAAGGGPRTFHLSEARDQISVAVIGNRVIMAGGHGANGLYSDKVDIFNLDTEEFEAHSLSLSEGRAFLAAATVGTKAFFGGGQKASSNVGSTMVDVFDFSTSPATVSQTQLSQPRYYLSAAATGSIVFFAGGGLGSTPYNDVDIFDVSNSIPPSPFEEQLSLARIGLVGAGIGTKVLFAGGIASGNNYTNLVNIYDTEKVKPTLSSLQPLDGAEGVSYQTDLVLTFSEKVKAGTGEIHITENGVAKTPISITHSSVAFSDNKITIDLSGLKSSSVITVEIAPGVIKDLAGNSFDGLVSPDLWNFETETLVTVSQTSYISTFEKGGADQKVSMTVNDADNVAEVKFVSRGISEDPASVNFSTIPNTGNLFEYTLTSSKFSDPIGLYYYFEYKDISGRVDTTRNTRTYIKFPTKESSDQIPSLRNGNTMDKYQIISIPMDLENPGVTSVFSALLPYDNKKWRLYDFDGGSNTNREYPAFQNINTGWGYWLITLNSETIRPGPGTTAKFSNEVGHVPFLLTLKPGWNLIGNPYNFALSWTDILDANPIVASNLQEDMSVYKTGMELTSSIRIDAYRGAFVKNLSSSNIIIKIPVRRNPTIPGRTAAEDVDLSSLNWHLPLEVSDGTMKNGTAGIGMNKKAKLTGTDRYDRTPVPMPEEIGMFEIAVPHPEMKTEFVREIVPSADSHVWDFEIHRTSDKPLTISWDNSLIKDSDKQLFLIDLSFGTIKDMKTDSYYIIPGVTKNLKVIFGNGEFIQQKMDEMLPLSGHPYPNPAQAEVKIPFHIPSNAGAMNVNVQVFNSQGVAVQTLVNRTYDKGSHEVIWDTGRKIGLYLIQMKVGTDKPRWHKVVVN